jgi:hypothetical protein
MPADLTPGADPIGTLCDHHTHALRLMQAHGHVDADATARAARDIGRQCPHCTRPTQ